MIFLYVKCQIQPVFLNYLVNFDGIAQLIALQPDGFKDLLSGTRVSYFFAKSVNLRLQGLLGEVILIFL